MAANSSDSCGTHRRVFFFRDVFLVILFLTLVVSLQGCGGGGGGGGGHSDSFRHPAMNLLQWNPHWQCMQDTACKNNVRNLSAQRLKENIVDFANFVELDADWEPPSPWKKIQKQCGKDVVALVFDSTKWKANSSKGAIATGCIEGNDRPYIVQQFNGLNDVKLVVVGAHYSHCVSIGNLASDTRVVMQATGGDRMILIADTNRYALGVSAVSTGVCNSQDTGPCSQRATCQSNEELLEQVLGVSSPLVSAKLHATCCKDSKLPLDKSLVFPFDRIIGNFEGTMETLLLDSPLPTWATTQFHQALLGKLNGDAGDKSLTKKVVI